MAGTEESGNTQRLLQAWANGEPDAFQRLYEYLYEDIRKLARIRMNLQKGEGSTAMVHDLYLRVCASERRPPDRAAFFAFMARSMFNYIHDERRKAKDHTPPENHALADGAPSPEDILHYAQYLEQLEKLSPFQADVFRMKYAGMTTEEIVEET